MRPAGAGLRIEVDAQLVGQLGGRPPRRPRVKVERAEVGGPDGRGGVRHAQLVGVAPAGEVDPRRLDPVRPLGRHPLLVDRRRVRPVGVALEDARPLPQRPHQTVGHGHDVLDEMQLGLAAGAEVDLVGVGHLDRDPLDVEFDER